MKKVFSKLLFSTCLFFLGYVKIYGQINPAAAAIDINNVKATVQASGDLFRDLKADNPAFESPQGTGKNTIYASCLWVGGLDFQGQLKMSAQTYRQMNMWDFNVGPLDIINVTPSVLDTIVYNRIWKIKQSDIDTFKNGGQATDDILYWPALGITAANESKFLAPFFNVGGPADFYSPSQGDYPCIKGDEALYFIYNDAGNHTATGVNGLGLEIHTMVYAFNTGIPAVDNTVFVDYKIIKRSTDVNSNTYIGLWTDFDIGDYDDDYLGCDVKRDAFFGYNGDANDGNGGTGTYGSTPPAQATVILRGPLADIQDNYDNNHNGVTDEQLETIGMSYFMYMNNDASVTGNPNTANDYYNFLKGYWKDGSQITYGGSGYNSSIDKCKYLFPGNSDPTGYGTNGVIKPAWDEKSANQVPGDRRGIASMGPFTFMPGQVQYISVAHLYSRASSGTNLSSVTSLKSDIDVVRSFFHANASNAFACDNHPVGIEKITNKNSDQYVVYPNPSNGKFVIKTFGQSVNMPYEIFDYTGRIVASGQLNATKTSFDISELGQGLYLLKISDIESKVISVMK